MVRFKKADLPYNNMKKGLVPVALCLAALSLFLFLSFSLGYLGFIQQESAGEQSTNTLLSIKGSFMALQMADAEQLTCPSGFEPFEIDIKEGHNFVSFPTKTLTDEIKKQLLSEFIFYRYSSENNNYFRADTLETLETNTGYVLSADKDTKIQLCKPIKEETYPTSAFEAKAGWNLVPGTFKPMSAAAIKQQVKSGPFELKEGVYIEAVVLEPGKSYWVFVEEPESIEGLPGAMYAVMAVDIYNCQDLTSTGEYNLAADLRNDMDYSDCLSISAPMGGPYVIDCQGRTISVDADYASAIYSNGPVILRVRNCNFDITGTHSKGIEAQLPSQFIVENCTFNLHEGEYISGIMSNSWDTLIDFDEIDVTITNLNHSNGMELIGPSSVAEISNTEISFEDSRDTAGIGIQDSRDVDISTCNAYSLDDLVETCEQIVGYSVVSSGDVDLYDVNADFTSRGATGTAIVNSFQDITITSSTYNLTGPGIIGIYLDGVFGAEINNVTSTATSNDSIPNVVSAESENPFVQNALLYPVISGFKYNWLYSLLTEGSNNINIYDNSFTARCVTIGGSSTGVGGAWEEYTTMAVRLDDSYQNNFFNIHLF